MLSDCLLPDVRLSHLNKYYLLTYLLTYLLRKLNKKASIRWQDSAPPISGYWPTSELANQWAERRLMTQWRHGCRAMRRSVCNAGASNVGRSLCVQISRERSYPRANILIQLERQLTALHHCRWEFLYNETLQQTFRPLLSKLTKRRQI